MKPGPAFAWITVLLLEPANHSAVSRKPKRFGVAITLALSVSRTEKGADGEP